MDTDILRDFVAGAWSMRWLFVSLYAFGVTCLAYLWRADRDDAHRTQIQLATRAAKLQRRLDSSNAMVAEYAERLVTMALREDEPQSADAAPADLVERRDPTYVDDRLPEWLKGGE